MQTLPNNVLLLTEPVAQTKTAAIGFWFSAGSRFEGECQHGIAHFTEHMLFKGTTTRTSHDISCTFDRIGGYANAFTERETVCVYCTVPAVKGAVQKAVELFCDMSTNALFAQEEIEKERTVIQNEIAAAEDDPEEAALDKVAAAIWPGQNISRSIGGTVAEVAQITRESLLDWYQEKIVQGELVVCAAGNFDEQEIIDLIKNLPLHKRCGMYPKHFENEKPKFEPGLSFIQSRFSQEQLFVLRSYRTPVDEKEYFALAVLNAIAGDSTSSRLFETLREKSGFCYTVYSFFTFYEDACVWCAYASADKKMTRKVSALLLEEIKNLVIVPAEEKEIEAAKEHLCGEEIISSDETEYCMKRLLRNYEMGFELRDTDSTVQGIRAVTKEDIIQAAEKLLGNDAKSAFISFGPRLPHAVKKEIICQIK